MKKEKKPNPLIEEFKKQEAADFENFLENKERYDLYLRLLKRTESWDELASTFQRIASELEIESTENSWLEDNLDCGPFYVLEKSIKECVERLGRCRNDYQRHIQEREIHMLQLALKKLKEVLTPVNCIIAMTVNGTS